MLGKTTLTRAIKRGTLSATGREDGSYAIDPSELARGLLTLETPETGPATGYAARRATPMALQMLGCDPFEDVRHRRRFPFAPARDPVPVEGGGDLSERLRAGGLRGPKAIWSDGAPSLEMLAQFAESASSACW